MTKSLAFAAGVLLAFNGAFAGELPANPTDQECRDYLNAQFEPDAFAQGGKDIVINAFQGEGACAPYVLRQLEFYQKNPAHDS